MEISEAGMPCLAHYRIVKLLGQGGMGIVYLGIDKRTGEKAAIKFLQDSRSCDPKRFIDESKAASAVKHKDIVPILEVGVSNLYGPFIAFEYLPGGSLKEYLAEHGPMSVHEAVDRVARPMLQALSALHSSGIIHRDIKPENILIDGHGNFRISDLGLAVFEGRTARTATGTMIGSPGYMSPDRILDNNIQANPSWDCYAAAVVLIETITGKLPFHGKSPPEILRDQLERRFTVKELAELGIQRQTAHVLVYALSNDTESRLDDADLFLEELDKSLLDNSEHSLRTSISVLPPGKQSEALSKRVKKTSKQTTGLRLRFTVTLLLISLVLLSLIGVKSLTKPFSRRSVPIREHQPDCPLPFRLEQNFFNLCSTARAIRSKPGDPILIARLLDGLDNLYLERVEKGKISATLHTLVRLLPARSIIRAAVRAERDVRFELSDNADDLSSPLGKLNHMIDQAHCDTASIDECMLKTLYLSRAFLLNTFKNRKIDPHFINEWTFSLTCDSNGKWKHTAGLIIMLARARALVILGRTDSLRDMFEALRLSALNPAILKSYRHYISTSFKFITDEKFLLETSERKFRNYLCRCRETGTELQKNSYAVLSRYKEEITTNAPCLFSPLRKSYTIAPATGRKVVSHHQRCFWLLYAVASTDRATAWDRGLLVRSAVRLTARLRDNERLAYHKCPFDDSWWDPGISKQQNGLLSLPQIILLAREWKKNRTPETELELLNANAEWYNCFCRFSYLLQLWRDYVLAAELQSDTVPGCLARSIDNKNRKDFKRALMFSSVAYKKAARRWNPVFSTVARDYIGVLYRLESFDKAIAQCKRVIKVCDELPQNRKVKETISVCTIYWAAANLKMGRLLPDMLRTRLKLALKWAKKSGDSTRTKKISVLLDDKVPIMTNL